MKNLTEFMKMLMYLFVILAIGYIVYLVSIERKQSNPIDTKRIDSLLIVNKKLSDSIEIQYKKIIFTESYLKKYKDSLILAKKQVYVKKASDLHFISLDSNIVILTKLLTEEGIIQ